MHIIIPLTAFFVSYISIYLLLKLPSNMAALDEPNHRSLHITPVSRLGGIGIISGIMFASGLMMLVFPHSDELLVLAAGFIIVAGISFFDDIYSLGSLIRILVHAFAAALVIYSGLVVDELSIPFVALQLAAPVAILVTLLYIIWMVNLYNFMDGIDGLAGGMAVFGFGTLAVIGYLEMQSGFATLSLVVALSSLGFLVWNYPPARIFMGDSGSSSLGFLAAVLSIWAHVHEIMPIWISWVIFSPFIVDATVTLIIRIIKRERFWAAHKSHYYQLLAESGMDRRRLVNYEYLLMLVCSVIAIISYKATPGVQAIFMVMLVILYIILMRYARKQAVKSGKPVRI